VIDRLVYAWKVLSNQVNVPCPGCQMLADILTEQRKATQDAQKAFLETINPGITRVIEPPKQVKAVKRAPEKEPEPEMPAVI
jgi:hypothetical protein